jgi:hypothetical protein
MQLGLKLRQEVPFCEAAVLGQYALPVSGFSYRELQKLAKLKGIKANQKVCFAMRIHSLIRKPCL